MNLGAESPGPSNPLVPKLAAGPQRLHYWTHEAYERHRRLHSGSARRDKRKQYAKQLLASEASSTGTPLEDAPPWEGDGGDHGVAFTEGCLPSNLPVQISTEFRRKSLNQV